MSFNESIKVLVDSGSPDTLAAIEEDLSTIYSTILVGFAGFTVLIYDHLITFADEVRYIWYTSRGPFTYLFLTNRYLIPLGFIINLYAYLSDWNPETCARYVRYEGAMTVIGINIVGLMMFLRVRALYGKNMIVVCSVASLLALEFGVNAWLLTHGIPVGHIGPRYPCTMVFDANLTKIAAASAWLPLLYDTAVMGLTAHKAYRTRSLHGYFHSQILQTMLAEGMIYYSVIFSITLTLAIMIAVSPPGIQNITAQLELLLTVAMMSRVTIDLKKHAKDHVHYDLSRHLMVKDEEGPYCYQLSHVRFRDIITGGKTASRHAMRTRESALKQKMGNQESVPKAGAIVVPQGPAVAEVPNLM